jgi:hypothetical protein
MAIEQVLHFLPPQSIYADSEYRNNLCTVKARGSAAETVDDSDQIEECHGGYTWMAPALLGILGAESEECDSTSVILA